MPKRFCHMRLICTRAVSGCSGDTSHCARPSRLWGESMGRGGRNAGVPVIRSSRDSSPAREVSFSPARAAVDQRHHPPERPVGLGVGRDFPMGPPPHQLGVSAAGALLAARVRWDRGSCLLDPIGEPAQPRRMDLQHFANLGALRVIALTPGESFEERSGYRARFG